MVSIGIYTYIYNIINSRLSFMHTLTLFVTFFAKFVSSAFLLVKCCF